MPNYSEMRTVMKKILDGRYTKIENQKDLCLALLEIAQREKAAYYVAFAQIFLGDYFISQNDCKRAGEYLEIAKNSCKENGYDDLLPRIYNLYGICYEALGDEQTAVQYYLRSLQYAKKVNNHLATAIIFNNIASNFALLRDNEAAKQYYIQACLVLDQLPAKQTDASYVKLRIWSNYSEVCGELNDGKEMKHYLQQCERVRGDVKMAKKYTLCRGWCHYYVLYGDIEKAEQCAKDLLTYSCANEYFDKILTYEMLISSCRMMVEAKRQGVAWQLLEHILSLVQDEEVDHILRVQKLRVQYYEAFGTSQEKLAAYEEYYKEVSRFEQNVLEVKARGLKNIIYLDDIKNTLTQETKLLHDEAHFDELTQLYNRRYFNKMITKAFLDEKTTSMGFVMLDLDYFKEYNDTYGHAKGDVALCAVAGILGKNGVAEIIPCRYGGDEFVALCVNATDDQILGFVQGVRADLDCLDLIHEGSRCSSNLTLSIGYSNSPISEGCYMDELFDRADRALYQSKAAGRNTFSRLRAGERADACIGTL